MFRILEPCEINQVLQSHHTMWSPGLDASRYRHYQWWQFKHEWGRRHLAYYGYFDRSGKIVASCKRYKFDYISRGVRFHVGGIGAVFVPESERGHAYGQKLLKELARQSRLDGMQALLLNSDIDPTYYEEIGYEQFDAEMFSLPLDEKSLGEFIVLLEALAEKRTECSFTTRMVSVDDFADMNRLHRRWLARREYGLLRTVGYLKYKVGRELYLYKHSKLNWPKPEIILLHKDDVCCGYILFEQSGAFLRLIELIAAEKEGYLLIAHLLRLAQRRNIKTLRGWEIMHPPVKGATVVGRDWSLPMIHTLERKENSRFQHWLEISPPSMLELDHF